MITKTRQEEVQKCSKRVSELSTLLTNYILKIFGEFQEKVQSKIEELKKKVDKTEIEKQEKYS